MIYSASNFFLFEGVLFPLVELVQGGRLENGGGMMMATIVLSAIGLLGRLRGVCFHAPWHVGIFVNLPRGPVSLVRSHSPCLSGLTLLCGAPGKQGSHLCSRTAFSLFSSSCCGHGKYVSLHFPSKNFNNARPNFS